MKRTLNILYLVGLLIAGSCFEPPQYSVFPSIEFDNLTTKNGSGTSSDSLIVSVRFWDGDGDLGISPDENSYPPFNNRWYFLQNAIQTCEEGVAAPCKKISYVDKTKLASYVTYKLRRTSPNYDTLPEFIAPYSCSRYTVLRDIDNKVIDTLYSWPNPFYYNFLLDLYIKNGNTFTKFEWNQFLYPNCVLGGLNGSFPVLAKDLSNKLPLEGIITYKITTALLSNFGTKTLKVKIRIIDRAGHKSNEVESKEFIMK